MTTPISSPTMQAVDHALGSSVITAEDLTAAQLELHKAKLQYNLEQGKLELEADRIDIADAANARDAQVRIQQTEGASWLAKNIQALLALAIVLITFLLYAYIIFNNDPNWSSPNSQKKEILIYILGTLTTLATTVAGYFFGSSHSSAEKTKAPSDSINKRSSE